MPKEKKTEALADYVSATYVDDTVFCFHKYTLKFN